MRNAMKMFGLLSALVLSACGGDDALRDKVLELLTHAEDETILRAEFLQLRSLFMVPRLTIGTRLGRYEIVAHIGEGGMGEVYEARDLRLERTVAIKVLRPWLSSHPQFRERLEREAKAISKLSHPHICTLHDIGHEDLSAYTFRAPGKTDVPVWMSTGRPASPATR